MARSRSTVEAPKRNGNSNNPPSPNVNANGGVPREDVVRLRVQDRLRVAVANGKDVPVEMGRRLGFSGGTRRKSYQGDVIMRGGVRREAAFVRVHPRFKAAVSGIAEIRDRLQP